MTRITKEREGKGRYKTHKTVIFYVLVEKAPSEPIPANFAGWEIWQK